MGVDHFVTQKNVTRKNIGRYQKPMEAGSDLLRKRALAKMRSPYQMSVICIDITNKCDLACSNCTRLLQNQSDFWDMTPDNFRLAVRSLDGYPGIIAIIGGNPAMHPKFKEICNVFVQEVPNKSQRGLWTNNVFKHGELAKDTFGVFNLNPHEDARGIKSLEGLKTLGWYYGGHSSHSPLLTAVKDLYSELDMWDRISHCDINHNWSASIIQNKGNLRAYFCEVAASFDLARGTDHGIPLEPGWWRRNISEFDDQVAHFCPGCGVPAELKGHMDFEETDTYTASNADIARQTKNKKRKVIELETGKRLSTRNHKFTEYSKTLRPQNLAQKALRKLPPNGLVRRVLRALRSGKSAAERLPGSSSQ